MPTGFVEPQYVDSLEDCVFYHAIDLPKYGSQSGMWDLRPNVNKYLGNVDLSGKRVLELGTASGYLCFHMESEGADVVAFELAPDEESDIVPFARGNPEQGAAGLQLWLEKVRNSFWLSHRVMNSSANVVYGNVYAVPKEVGRIDVSTFGSILLHLRDPFRALQSALRLTRETVIVSEPVWNWINFLRFLAPSQMFGSSMFFQPDSKSLANGTTWWHISPAAIRRFIAVLGFEDSRVNYHYQLNCETGRKVLCYTVVGKRTVPLGDQKNGF